MSILIAYASKNGATKDAATILAQKLPGKVQLCDINERQPDPAAYDIIILGGAVYAGTLPKGLKNYAKTHAAALAKKPLGLFVGCSESDKAEEFLKANLPDELCKKAKCKASFGGEFRTERMGFLEKGLLKMVTKANGGSRLPSIDHQAIEVFAAGMIA